jgi:hypothetical protein
MGPGTLFLHLLLRRLVGNVADIRWEKYNYLTEAGFDVGIAISGLIQTLIFAFSNGGDGISLTWWGNTVATKVSPSLPRLESFPRDVADG